MILNSVQRSNRGEKRMRRLSRFHVGEVGWRVGGVVVVVVAAMVMVLVVVVVLVVEIGRDTEAHTPSPFGSKPSLRRL
ncbi:hypothetical protein E2C01_097338 [Portunus trituberculatus]|uniref:Uncharacterized protein n=1 Tax=Portunus trituberculatus TaxID=210409 RepID=A0A5B7K060_PORTR|nr:hypothetical protein [Portunus trituberculatus]